MQPVATTNGIKQKSITGLDYIFKTIFPSIFFEQGSLETNLREAGTVRKAAPKWMPN